MFEAEEDGGVAEDDLSVILRTTLGLSELRTSHMFRVLDTAHKGRVTFGMFYYTN